MEIKDLSIYNVLNSQVTTKFKNTVQVEHNISCFETVNNYA